LKLSLKLILIVGLVGLVTISVTFIILSSSFTSRKALLNHANDIMQNISAYTINKSYNHLIPARDAAILTSGLAVSNIVSSDNFKAMESYFYEQLSVYYQFSGIYYGNSNGEFIMASRSNNLVEGGFLTKSIRISNESRKVEMVMKDATQKEISREFLPTDNYDPRKRPWYIDALREKKLIWTDPYVFFTSKKPGITTASPIFDKNGNIKGVVGVDIAIDEISNFISKLKIGKNGKTFIVNHNGDVIAYPDISKIKQSVDKDNSIRLVKINEIDDEICRKAYETLKEKNKTLNLFNSEFVSFNINKKTYHAMFSPFEDKQWPWLIGIYLPENDYLGVIKKNDLFNIYISIIIMIIAIIIGSIIAKSILIPVAHLQRSAIAVKRYDFKTAINISSIYKEIQDTISSFEEMRIHLKEYRESNNALTEKLEGAHLDTLFRLAVTAEYKDRDTASHIERVSGYCEIIATTLGLDKENVNLLKYASSMHDVGKLGVPDDILLKKGALTSEEREVMELHTIIGGNILKDPSSDIMKMSREIALTHHEKWDGTGYPNGLSGEDIPLNGRIVAIADVFDALVSKRCYRDALSIEEAKVRIEKGRGNHFDPTCVDAFFKSFRQIINVYINNS
jgi:putative two-component system response regulator